MKLPTDKHIWSVTIHQNNPELPWLVLLHGFMGSGDVFLPLLPRLSKVCNPVTVDLPGHGDSSLETDPGMYSEKILVEDLHSVLSRLNFSPAILCGYSLGGRLLLQYALNFEHSFDKLILESSTPGIEEFDIRSKRIQEDDERAGLILDDFNRFLDDWHNKPLFTSESKDPEHLSLYKNVMKSQYPASMAAVLKGFGTGKMTPAWGSLEKLKKPVCLISGVNDNKFTAINSRMKSLLPQAELVIIPGAAHRPHLDQPDVYIKQVQTFIISTDHELEND